ncbi:slipin family protein [Candidatus Sumerlaeota bacterium]|nr:slipin family protein [Candidatus Sumerlaeota bacterium]
MLKWLHVREHERGVLFRGRKFVRILPPGRYVWIDPLGRIDARRYCVKEVIFEHDRLSDIWKSRKTKPGVKFVNLQEHERAFVWTDGRLAAVLRPGLHALWTLYHEVQVQTASARDGLLNHPQLDVIAKSGYLGDEALALELEDHQRALIWIDGRFFGALREGLYVLWQVYRKVRHEIIDAREVRFEHPRLTEILRQPHVANHLDLLTVESGHIGLYFLDGTYQATLQPGRYAFWKTGRKVQVKTYDLREQLLDIAGQEIITKDHVSLRLNAVVAYQTVDPLKAAREVENYSQALYREAQLALREVIGTRELDVLLSEKDAASAELLELARVRAEAYGVQVLTFGIRDIILPGEMRELLNRVTEARKAAEADLITRREETASMRSQANTAKILESNPTLLRLRELETLERVAENSNLTVLLGEQGLSERISKLI